MTPMQRIEAERKRQIEREGWTTEHDDAHTDGSLLIAAVCYYRSAKGEFPSKTPPPEWPWHDDWWKPAYPQHPERDLERSGGLFLAERERRERAGIPETKEFVTILDKIEAGLATEKQSNDAR